MIWRRLCSRPFCVMSTTLDAFFAPPVTVRGMRVLDRTAFRRTVTLPAVFLRPTLCASFLKRLQYVLLKFPRVKKIQSWLGEDGKEDKVILLTPEACCKTPISKDDLQWITSNGGRVGSYSLELDYRNYSTHHVLSAVLPEGTKEIPTGCEIVGHIAHLNLRQEHLPYKAVIGEVMLDQQTTTKTVVNKTDSIDNTFRFFKMELLAGEDDMVTTVHENGCAFTFDYSKVYWNSRLHTEHERVLKMIERGEVVVDVFAGVGPFAIPACMKGCTVYANDLNPSSHQALVENAKKNKVGSSLHAFNMDGREFLGEIIPRLVVESLGKDTTPAPVICSHVIMNLPAIAVQFLDAFRGLFQEIPQEKRKTVALPMVHCYCFSKSEDPDKDSLESVQMFLGTSLVRGNYSVYNVRQVAPNKWMMRVSFRLPPEIAFSENCSKPVVRLGVSEKEEEEREEDKKEEEKKEEEEEVEEEEVEEEEVEEEEKTEEEGGDIEPSAKRAKTE